MAERIPEFGERDEIRQVDKSGEATYERLTDQEVIELLKRENQQLRGELRLAVATSQRMRNGIRDLAKCFGYRR